MAETALVPSDRRLSPQQAKFISLAIDHPDLPICKLGEMAGYKNGSLRSWIYNVVSNPKIETAIETGRAKKRDKARALLDRGDRLLEKGAAGAERANDYQTMGVLGAQHVKLGLEYKEKHGESEEHDPASRQSALRKGHLRLAYSILRATAVWEPARLLAYLEKVRQELDIHPTTADTP